MKIPKIIHQTYKSYESIPTPIKRINNELKEMNPDWEYRFYDDKACEDYIAKNYNPEVLNLYKAINPVYGAAKADLFRYLVIYQDGGAYLDIKSTCAKPLSEIIKQDDEILFSFWSFASDGHQELKGIAYSEIPQWYIVAKPKSAFIKAVIDQVLDNIRNYSIWHFKIGSKGVFRTTGPVVYTKTILPLLSITTNTFKQDITDFGFIYSGLNKKNHHSDLYNSHYSLKLQPIVLSSNIIDIFSNFFYYFTLSPKFGYILFKRALPRNLKRRLKKYKFFNYF